MQAGPKQQRSSSAHERNKVHDFIIEVSFPHDFIIELSFPLVLHSPLKESPLAASQAPLSLPLLKVVLLSPMN
jgi:hypothetical protein